MRDVAEVLLLLLVITLQGAILFELVGLRLTIREAIDGDGEGGGKHGGT